MSTWLRQHLLALGEACRLALRGPGSFLLNVLVIAIALALPFAGLTVLENVRPLSEQLAVEPEISLFLSMDTPRERATALAPQIRRVVQDFGSSARLEFIPRENALNQLNSKSGLSDAITALGENPLPDGYVLKLTGFQNGVDAARIDTLAAQLKALPGVEYVQVDSAWVKRLAALMHVARVALIFLGTMLGAVIVAVAFNTIRLQVMTQDQEIMVCRMFGATDAWIRRPFYYAGALLGLCAGALALGMVVLALHPLNEAIAGFARLYASEFRLAAPALPMLCALLAVSAALGWAGALLSVWMYSHERRNETAGSR
jgi:cell division transport system permease protein